MDQLIEDKIAEGDLKEANRLTQQKIQEETRLVHRRVKITTKDFVGAPYHMELEGTKKSFVSTDKDAMERALIDKYNTKYHLAHSSPFLQEPLLREFGQMTINDNAAKVVKGEYVCPPGVKNHTKIFIKHLAMDPAIRDLPVNKVQISTSECNEFWRNMKERVSSSRSTRHIGTYKAAALHNTNAKIQATMLSIPYETGVPLERTTNNINVSLLKKGKGIRPKDLRTIWLLEADFNAGAKIHFVKRMMNETAISNTLIPASQYAKKNDKAIEAALVKVLFFDYLRQTRKPGVIFASDLMQCFDRMAHPVCSLVSQRLGVDVMVIKCMLSAIQHMTHYIRTGYGDSDRCYGNDPTRPLQGGDRETVLPFHYGWL